MEFGIGLANGLAQDLGYNDRINDLRYRNEAQQRTEALNEAKRRMFDQDTEYQNAMNSYDNPKVREFANNQIHKLANFVRENPDYQTSFEKREQFKSLKRQFKDNPILHRGMASDMNMRELDKDLQEMAKNPQQHDSEAYQDLLNQKQNYLQFGNQHGKDARDQFGEQAFSYVKPQDFADVIKENQDTGNKFKHNSLNSDIVPIKNGRDGAYRIMPKPSVIHQMAVDKYLARKRQYDVQYASKGIDPIKEISNQIASGIEEKFDIGDKNTLNDDLLKIKFKHSLDNAAANGGNPYKISLFDPSIAAPGSEKLSETFGSQVPHFFKGPDGKLIKNTGDTFHYEGDIFDKGYRADKKYAKTGVKQMNGFFYKPLEWGKENGYTYDPWGFGEHAVEPGMKDVMEIVNSPVDENGKSHKLLKVKGIAEVNANDSYPELKFNKSVLTNKQREAVGVDESMLDQPKTTLGSIVTDNKTGQKYKVTSDGFQIIN